MSAAKGGANVSGEGRLQSQWRRAAPVSAAKGSRNVSGDFGKTVVRFTEIVFQSRFSALNRPNVMNVHFIQWSM
jgi:hypothetical protein